MKTVVPAFKQLETSVTPRIEVTYVSQCNLCSSAPKREKVLSYTFSPLNIGPKVVKNGVKRLPGYFSHQAWVKILYCVNDFKQNTQGFKCFHKYIKRQINLHFLHT